MENNVFVDTDVIIDLLIDRQPHAQSASLLFDLAEKKEVRLYASSLCFNNVHYITRKILGDIKARKVLKDLIEIIEVLSVSKHDLINAINSEFKDFEDAIQYSVALSQNHITSIVTRNIKDYSKSEIPVFAPDLMIQIIKNEK